MRGAWIEIQMRSAIPSSSDMSLPVRGAWIEIGMTVTAIADKSSLPVRGAWIEI